MITTEPASEDRVVLRILGTLDDSVAQELDEMGAATPAGASVLVEFCRVQEFHDPAVVLLAQGVAHAAARVSLLGLGQHQHRILRYLDSDGGSARLV